MANVTDTLLRCVYTVDCSSWCEAQLQLCSYFAAVHCHFPFRCEVLDTFTEQLCMNVHIFMGAHIMLLKLTHQPTRYRFMIIIIYIFPLLFQPIRTYVHYSLVGLSHHQLNQL